MKQKGEVKRIAFGSGLGPRLTEDCHGEGKVDLGSKNVLETAVREANRGYPNFFVYYVLY